MLWNYHIQSPFGPLLISLQKQRAGLEAHSILLNPNASQLKALGLNEPVLQGIRFSYLKLTKISTPLQPQPAPAQIEQLANQIHKQLQKYFKGYAVNFNPPLAAAPSPWQHRVRQALLKLPYAEVRTYAQIARQLGSPQAAQAVGQACARNPYHIVVPCHRIVSRQKQRLGYAGGGPQVQSQLLTMEGATLM